MSNDLNPYDVSPESFVELRTSRQKLSALAVGTLVTVASLVTMCALLFGVMIAFGGRSMPSPVDLSAVLVMPEGKAFLIAGLSIVPVSMVLGYFSARRVARVQNLLQQSLVRRNELRGQLEEIRKSRSSG